MNEHDADNPWQEKQIPLQDVVISNSWALQAILMYLDEQNPGARDHIWQLYTMLKEEAERHGIQTDTSTGESDVDDPPPN